MAYGTVADLRDYLPQVPTGAANDTLLQKMLDRASGIVDGYLGLSFAGYDASASARKFNSDGGTYLRLPAYQSGSLTSVKRSVVAITDYEIQYDDPRLLWRTAGWESGRYEAIAKWGYGAVTNDVLEVALELAVNLWRGRERGMWSDVIGAEGGGAVGYARALTHQQRMVLDDVRIRVEGLGIA